MTMAKYTSAIRNNIQIGVISSEMPLWITLNNLVFYFYCYLLYSERISTKNSNNICFNSARKISQIS